MTKQARLHSFDIAKLIAVLAVILSHTLISEGFNDGSFVWLSDACFSFDMPLFFIVSGYFLKPTQLTTIFVAKQARLLLLPYVTTVLIVIVGSIVWNLLFSPQLLFHVMKGWIVAGCYGAGISLPTMLHQVQAIGAIWFLPALFFAKLLLAATDDKNYQPAFVLLCFIVGVVSVEKVFLPWSVQPALCSVLFLWLGREVRRYQILNLLGNPLIFALCLFVTYYNARYFGHLYLVHNAFEDGIVRDVVFSTISALTLLKCCILVERGFPRVSRAFGFLGSLTLAIFCMHLVELNTIDYQYLFDQAHVVFACPWVYVFGIRLVVIAMLCVVLYVLPGPLRKIYYPHLRTARGLKSAAQ